MVAQLQAENIQKTALHLTMIQSTTTDGSMGERNVTHLNPNHRIQVTDNSVQCIVSLHRHTI